MEQVYEVWIEIQANKQLILDKIRFVQAVKKCREAGMTGVILSVKDTSGFVLYPSALADHYSSYDHDFSEKKDYVKQCFDIIRGENLKCYAAFDVFTEGNKQKPHPKMKGFQNGFECEVYGLDESGKPAIRKSTEAEELQTVGSIDDFGEIFVNPDNPDVREYEMNLIEEFAQKYQPDGIVLDRVRYVGLSADFSERSKKAWESYSGITDECWPKDIYTIQKTEDGLKEIPGKYFGAFYEYRSHVIRNFMEEVKKRLKMAAPETEFCNYTGSWYPLYDRVGANWGSENYRPNQFPWCDGRKLEKNGYAELTDRLMSGFYYSDIWISEARSNHRPADWYSVEGSYEIASRVTNRKEGLVGSLFIEQYKECPWKLPEAISLCLEKTSGCMIFDLSYIIKYDWWNMMKKVSIKEIEQNDLQNLTDICRKAFPEEYHVTKDKIERHLLKDAEYSSRMSRKIVDETTGDLIGFLGVKISKNQQLYPDTAWISLFAVMPEEQKKGYGQMLLDSVCENLKKRGIRKIYVGQDFNNFFSGIPDPDDRKKHFFEKNGFNLNVENHYDLEADIVENHLIDDFDTVSFEKEYLTDSYHGEKEALISFIEREFPGRWVFEAEEALNMGKDAKSIILMWNKEKTEVLGYCMLSVDTDGYGGLGPVGIAKKIRGRHVGDYILNMSLKQLRNIGAKRVNIDWTILKDFYGQFGFLPERTYCGAYKEHKTKIVLLPLDERPCNYLFPQKLFQHDGMIIIKPDHLGNKKAPASIDDISDFLRRECRDADGLIISMDMLLYGGLIPSRIHQESKETLLDRIRILKEVRENNPNLMIYAFQVIMRCPNYSSSDEEPDYYEYCGKEIHDLGVAVHMSRLGLEEDITIEMASEKVDSVNLYDYISRRETNRYMNVETLQMVRDGLIDALVIPQDDSAPYGYAALDQKIIREKIREYNVEDKVLMYPGADEVELTLFSRMLNHLYGKKAKVYVKFASELSKGMIPLYEGSSLFNTVKYHLLAAGCHMTECYEYADIVLFITAPADHMEEASGQPSEKLEYTVERNIAEMMDVLKQCMEENKIVTIADNAYANGGDLEIIKVLNHGGFLMRIDGYAGWNTSANTLGTAIAEAVDSFLFGKTAVHDNFLAERYVEDAGYCSVVRKAVTAMLPDHMNYFDVKETDGTVAGLVMDGLRKFTQTELSSIAENLVLKKVSMPWRRMFEVDISVDYKNQGGMTEEK